MKFEKEVYENSQYFKRSDSSDSKRIQKVVKARSHHNCCLCDRDLPIYTPSLSVKEVIPGQGWIRSWICIPCCDLWIEKTHQS